MVLIDDDEAMIDLEDIVRMRQVEEFLSSRKNVSTKEDECPYDAGRGGFLSFFKHREYKRCQWATTTKDANGHANRGHSNTG